MMKPLKIKTSITLDEDVVETIKNLSEEDDRNFSQYVNMVLREWIMRKGSSTEKQGNPK